MNYFIAYTDDDKKIWGRGNTKHAAYGNASKLYVEDHKNEVEWWFLPRFKKTRCTKELYDLFVSADISSEMWYIKGEIARAISPLIISKKLPEKVDELGFISSFSLLAEDVYNTAKDRGWWECPDADRLDNIAESIQDGRPKDAKMVKNLADKLRKHNDGEAIALMHSELSEGLESVRKGNPPDSHIPEFSGLEAEFADCIIRIMNFSHSRNLRVAEAVIAKMKYNKTRAYKHGNKKF